MATVVGYTPRDLELMVKRELRKHHEIPEALIVEIMRDGPSWRAKARFKASDDLPDTRKDEIAARVEQIGRQLAPRHAMVG
ncbi:hypothetical protein [Tardiphaga sp.]|uniref:hypothetical protein n=1 Tax=Tardiphaga sp. TaxID=1926292 RepID=UPI0026266DE9|nr:hypothetical protein [Tardiphaga sp.]MDB5619496.1 hypothetical protein [Tardiphaga sp.]